MQPIISILSLLGPISLIIAQVVMGLLSKRLGEVTKRPPLYRWFYVGAGLVGASIVLQLTDVLFQAGSAVVILYDLVFTLGLALSIIVAWKYWGWLLSESGKKA